MKLERALALSLMATLAAGLGCVDSVGVTPGDSGLARHDAGTDPADAGSTPADAGTVVVDGGSDAGVTATDGGSAASVPLPVTIPANTADWTFYGPDQGLPNQVYGASYDAGGDLWVAGGTEGLFVLRPGDTSFTQLTMKDGLRPYGYMPDGSAPVGTKVLDVISVSGAWAGTVFVGYMGKPPAPGELDCESNWDGPNPDPSIYKSGDADRVTLTATGIDVVHYDISSGPGLVGAELRGREKLCDIYRVRYDPANDRVWFGANHGFAMGAAHYAGTGKCQWDSTLDPPVPTQQTSPFDDEPGHFGCSGVLEHVHPALNGYKADGSCCAYLTGGYYGVAVDPVTHDVWFGGQMRTTKFHYATTGGDYFQAQSETEDPPYIANRIDIWPDLVEEPQIPTVAERVDDFVAGAAAMNDGTVWLTSFVRGLAHLAADGTVLARLTTGDGLVANKLWGIAADPLDQSVWVGPSFVGGLSRLKDGNVTAITQVFGPDLIDEGVSDIQSWGQGASRKMVVSFAGNSTHAGAVAVYSGP